MAVPSKVVVAIAVSSQAVIFLPPRTLRPIRTYSQAVVPGGKGTHRLVQRAVPFEGESWCSINQAAQAKQNHKGS